jgi:uncharacterized protein
MPEHQITVILDTNVLIAAYWSPRSASGRIIRACIEGRIQAQYTPQIEREALTMLRKAQTSDAYMRSLEDFWAKAEEVEPEPSESVRTEDPDDQKFLEAALGGQADFLVTNDVHLLKVHFIGRTEILKPPSLLRVLEV